MKIQKRLANLTMATVLMASFLFPLFAFVPKAAADLTPPDDFTGPVLAEYNQGDNSIHLNWVVPTEYDPEAEGYHISWTLKGQNDWTGPYVLLGDGSTDIGIGIAQGLLPHRAYEFRVAAFNGAGEGAYIRSAPVLFGPHVYNITTCDELQDIDSDLMGDYTLANDIDCSETDFWSHGFSPISGTEFFTNAFQGTFDGKGHTITNLYTSHADEPTVGLFGTLGGTDVTVKNLTLEGCQIYGGPYTGALAGTVFGSINISDVNAHCLVVGNNNTNSLGPLTGVGGLVGMIAGVSDEAKATITRSHTSGVVAATLSDDGTLNINGGIVGLMLDNSILTNSYGSSIVIGASEGQVMVGGAVGATFVFGDGPAPVISNIYSIGGVSLKDGNLGGSLIGLAAQAEISNSFAASSISGTGIFDAGALIGYVNDINNVSLTNNFADATAVGEEYPCVGGVVDPVDDCTLVNFSANPDLNYFKGNHVNQPMASWDFSHIWKTVTDDYPVLDYRPPVDSGGSSGGGSSINLKKLKKELLTAKLPDLTTTAPQQIKLNDFDDYNDGSGHSLSDLMVGQVIHFDVTVKGVVEYHTMTIKEIGDGYVIVTIASTPFDVKLSLNEASTIAIDGRDVMVAELTGVNGASVSLKLSKISPTNKTTGAKTGTPIVVATTTKKSNSGLILGTIAALLMVSGAVYVTKCKK